MNKRSMGQKLGKLHTGNAWIVLLLAVSGILLYIPPMRALLGGGRVWLKQLHIAAGLVSLALVLLYLPHICKHVRSLVARRGQQANLVFVLLLLAGWIVTGVILWRFQWFPPAWNNAALLLHDALTWIGIPYAVYHSISRSRWLKKADRTIRHSQPQSATALPEAAIALGKPSDGEAGIYKPSTGRLFRSFSRRNFLRFGAGSLLAVIVGPFFYRWLTSLSGSGSYNTTSLQDALPPAAGVPQPSPLPDSLPPRGGGAKGNFRIYTVTDMPEFVPEEWSFRIDGLVERPRQWNWSEFLEIPRTVQVSDFHCITGWSVTSCTWEGIPMVRLLENAGVMGSAKTVKFYSSDGVYTDSLTLEQARLEDVMVVALLDGKPIPKELGGPVRLVVPQMYAYKSVKWLDRIELIDRDHTGYWEQRGYSKNAWVKSSG